MCRGRARVLELGCGAKQYGCSFPGRYFGIDLRLSRDPGPGADVLGDAQHLPLADGTVDAVFTVATLLVVPDTGMFLAECRRVLRDQGILAIFDYNWWVARRLALADPDHRHRFTSVGLARQLRRQGFEARIHWRCCPRLGPDFMRPLLDQPAARVLTYLVSNWVVVSGTKEGD